MKVLKGYVRARPEGCIAECYLVNESARFCSKYIPQAKDISERQDKKESDHMSTGHPIGAGEVQF